MPQTNDILTRLRAAIATVKGWDEQATPGPWEYDAGEIYLKKLDNGITSFTDAVVRSGSDIEGGIGGEDNGRLIVATRNILADQLAVMEAVAGRLADWHSGGCPAISAELRRGTLTPYQCTCGHSALAAAATQWCEAVERETK